MRDDPDSPTLWLEDLLARERVPQVAVTERNGSEVKLTEAKWQRFSKELAQYDGYSARLRSDFGIRAAELMSGGEIFVPKIPSMRIMDLVAAVAPDCKVELIGVRPGEKLHEILISEDESRQALEFDDMFVIEPLYPDIWAFQAPAGGKRVAAGFHYSSDANDRWLSGQQMREMAE